MQVEPIGPEQERISQHCRNTAGGLKHSRMMLDIDQILEQQHLDRESTFSEKQKNEKTLGFS